MSRPTIKDLEREFESGRGLYWDWFWDWKIKNEKAEKDILSTQLVKQSSNKLLTYLEVFSMFRNTNLMEKRERVHFYFTVVWENLTLDKIKKHPIDRYKI